MPKQRAEVPRHVAGIQVLALAGFAVIGLYILDRVEHLGMKESIQDWFKAHNINSLNDLFTSHPSTTQIDCIQTDKLPIPKMEVKNPVFATPIDQPVPEVKHPKHLGHVKITEARMLPVIAPVVPIVVEAPPIQEAHKDSYAVYAASTECDSTEQIAVVTRDGVQPGTVWDDKNQDGMFYTVKGTENVYAIDFSEFRGVDPGTVQRDWQYLHNHRGFMGHTMVYNITDSEGKNVVVCVEVDDTGRPKPGSWHLFHANHYDDSKDIIPKGHYAGRHPVLNSKTLSEDLALVPRTS